MIALLLAGCFLLPETQGDHSVPVDDSADDSPPVDTGDDPAADDAAVRALTDLPEGDDPCADPILLRVQYTVDGDTFYGTPDGGGAQIKVRMIGVDTPEVAHESGEQPECYGNEAWTYSAGELDDRLVWLTFDAECEDDFGRTLAYVHRGEGADGFFNRRLARYGFADTLEIAPNDTWADVFDADVAEARAAGRGMWSACTR